MTDVLIFFAIQGLKCEDGRKESYNTADTWKKRRFCDVSQFSDTETLLIDNDFICMFWILNTSHFTVPGTMLTSSPALFVVINVIHWNLHPLLI